MISEETKSVIQRAKKIYAEHLQSKLEEEAMDQFVSIEPDSAEYFLGDTFNAAVRSAREKFPSRLTHTIRIGHRAAFHIGVLQS